MNISNMLIFAAILFSLLFAMFWRWKYKRYMRGAPLRRFAVRTSDEVGRDENASKAAKRAAANIRNLACDESELRKVLREKRRLTSSDAQEVAAFRAHVSPDHLAKLDQAVWAVSLVGVLEKPIVGALLAHQLKLAHDVTPVPPVDDTKSFRESLAKAKESIVVELMGTSAPAHRHAQASR